MNNKDDIISVKKKQLDQLNEHRNQLYRNPQLRQLFFELTLKCNENCFHCGSRCNADGMDGLDLNTYKDILKDVKHHLDIDKLQICVTGGEPLLYPHFFDLMDYVNQQGFKWGMTSNATLITKEVARKLRDTGMGTISVSIDGLEDSHDLFRGRKGSWKKSMQGIQNLIDLDCFHSIQVTTVVNHDNINELDALYDIFETIDIDSWRVIGIEPIGRALDHPEKMLTEEEQLRLLSFIRDKRENHIPVTYGCSHYLGMDWEREVRDWYFLCNAGVYAASIMANGDICACLDIERRPETIQGNIKRECFSDVWKNKFQFFRHRLSEKSKECRNCSSEKYCAGGSFHSWDFDHAKQRICMKGILFG